jgi:hypothetical protein
MLVSYQHSIYIYTNIHTFHICICNQNIKFATNFRHWKHKYIWTHLLTFIHIRRAQDMYMYNYIHVHIVHAQNACAKPKNLENQKKNIKQTCSREERMRVYACMYICMYIKNTCTYICSERWPRMCMCMYICIHACICKSEIWIQTCITHAWMGKKHEVCI